MPVHVLSGILLLVCVLGGLTASLIAIRVIAPRRQRSEPIRRPFMLGVAACGVGLIAGALDLVLVLNS